MARTAAGVLAMSVMLTAGVAAEEERRVPEGNLLQNCSFEKKTADGVEGWMSRAWGGEEEARWTVEAPGRTGERCISIRSAEGADAAWTVTVILAKVRNTPKWKFAELHPGACGEHPTHCCARRGVELVH
ncbi:MAG: hypothetical protein GW802_15685 [Armatimonadetes bacterium]|nr:hypothetical protein [Armatimonadota bacterium]NCP34254.1 hypothetical protein [Armatimonadota bacterium]NCQ28850.1 hypothetical protein [Armatimonadota bacterium]